MASLNENTKPEVGLEYLDRKINELAASKIDNPTPDKLKVLAKDVSESIQWLKNQLALSRVNYMQKFLDKKKGYRVDDKQKAESAMYKTEQQLKKLDELEKRIKKIEAVVKDKFEALNKFSYGGSLSLFTNDGNAVNKYVEMTSLLREEFANGRALSLDTDLFLRRLGVDNFRELTAKLLENVKTDDPHEKYVSHSAWKSWKAGATTFDLLERGFVGLNINFLRRFNLGKTNMAGAIRKNDHMATKGNENHVAETNARVEIGHTGAGEVVVQEVNGPIKRTVTKLTSEELNLFKASGLVQQVNNKKLKESNKENIGAVKKSAFAEDEETGPVRSRFN